MSSGLKKKYKSGEFDTLKKKYVLLTKIAAIPIKFLTKAIIYYFLTEFKSSIIDYHQDMLMGIIFELRSIYNELSLKIFKKSTAFEYSIIILAKLT